VGSSPAGLSVANGLQRVTARRTGGERRAVTAKGAVYAAPLRSQNLTNRPTRQPPRGVITELTQGDVYTFTVVAANRLGVGVPSSPTAAVMG